MKKGRNFVQIRGNIGREPDVRSFPSGDCVCTLAVATSETWKDRQTGEQKEKTQWHRVVFKDRGAFKMGEIAASRGEKGGHVEVCGKLETREWTDKNGEKKYSTEIVVDEFEFLTLASRANAPDSSGQTQEQQPAQPQQSYKEASPGQRKGPDPAQSPENFDDDIPF